MVLQKLDCLNPPWFCIQWSPQTEGLNSVWILQISLDQNDNCKSIYLDDDHACLVPKHSLFSLGWRDLLRQSEHCGKSTQMWTISHTWKWTKYQCIWKEQVSNIFVPSSDWKGALVLDRVNKIAYMAESQRANVNAATTWAKKLGYELFCFGEAVDCKYSWNDNLHYEFIDFLRLFRSSYSFHWNDKCIMLWYSMMDSLTLMYAVDKLCIIRM